MGARKFEGIDYLNRIYQDALMVDRSIFAEMRSNILLTAGDHYSKRFHKYFSQIRDNRDLADSKKLRLTKNLLHKVHKRYVTNLIQFASGLQIVPQRDEETQDRKAAQLNNSVWQDAVYRLKLKRTIRNFASDFIAVGESICCVKWNPQKGKLQGYRPSLSPDGHEQTDESGAVVLDFTQPVFKGEFDFERWHGFNVFRDAGAQSMHDSPFIGYRKMVHTRYLRELYKDSPDKLKGIQETAGTDHYIIFDATKGGYDRTKNQTLVKEYYFRPSEEYPRGYYYIATDTVVLEEGELPFGVWPIAFQGFDEHPTSPRGRSIMKQLRPYQAELNRASSSIAMHQVTIGDDKILYQAGTRLAPGALLPGVRGITFQGQEPKILPGRDGSQYLPYLEHQKAELKDVADLVDVDTELGAKAGSNDMYAMLFRSALQRQKLSLYSQKFEEFLVEVVEIFLELARYYYPDDMLIPMIGKREMVNMAEFRSMEPLHYKIRIIPQDDTVETQYGKQLTIQHLIQYAGNQLGPAQLGLLARNLPLANVENLFGDFTLDYDIAENTVLALERGEYPATKPKDPHQIILQRITKRQKEADFQFLPPPVQQGYVQKEQECLQWIAYQEQKEIDAKNEYIPVDGPMVKADVYVPRPDDPSKTERAKIPQRAIEWLLQKLEAQGVSRERLDAMDDANLAQLADIFQQGGGAQAGPGLPPMAQAGAGGMM